MRFRSYTFKSEPRGRTYDRLVDFAPTECATALLVVRDPLALSPTAHDVLRQLDSCLRERSEQSEWPGTVLLGHTATVYRYSLTPVFLDTVKRVARGLFDWVEPGLPDDLCFLSADGQPWLVTIAHERDVYMELSEDQHARLLKQIPELAELLAADADEVS